MRKINTELSDYIGAYSITALIDTLGSVKEDAEISWNSFGGSVYAGQKLVDFLNNKENKLVANVSGIAASMGAAMLPFFDKTIGAKQADVMIHSITGGERSTRKHTNTFLYNALLKKIDEVKFKEVTGKALEAVMLAEDDDRIDVWITGKEAEYIGLFDETYDLLDKAASLENKVDVQELDYNLPDNLAEKYGFKPKQNQINNNNDMEIKDITIEGLKKENSTVHNAIVDSAKKAERLRVSAIMKYVEYDAKKVNEIIESGDALGVEDVEYFLEKKYNNAKVADLEASSEGEVAAAKLTKTEERSTEEDAAKEASLQNLRRDMNTADLMEEDKK